ncbi:hypothetical protein VKS41_009271 [Umbelopsis sp. WA50703]
MTITVSPGCALTSLIQPVGGNANCIGNYVEVVGFCTFTALNEQFTATCDSASACVLTYPGGTTHSIICDGSTQGYTSAVLGLSFTGSCTCTLTGAASVPVASSASVAASSSAPVAASSSVPAAASSAPAAASSGATAASSPAAALTSSANKLGKIPALLFSGIVMSMLVSMA